VAGTLTAQSLTLKQAVADSSGAATLQMAMSIELGPRATEALQAGLMLAFDVDWQLTDGRELHQSLALRYSPLLRSYQLAVGKTHPQTFTLRNTLLAAMENAQLRWPAEAACAGACGGRVRVRLDPAQLPAPLRLPALFDSDWDFDSGWREVEKGARGTGHGAQPAAQSNRGAFGKMLKSGAIGKDRGTGPATQCDPAQGDAPCHLPPAPLLMGFAGADQLAIAAFRQVARR